MSFIILFKVVAWTWFILIGVCVTLLVGNLFEMITRKQKLIFSKFLLKNGKRANILYYMMSLKSFLVSN